MDFASERIDLQNQPLGATVDAHDKGRDAIVNVDLHTGNVVYGHNRTRAKDAPILTSFAQNTIQNRQAARRCL
jgi:hypothetical protein